ncbi:hypothetical protein BCR37DRAFT_388441 [Protomyces lactucae-debilis]|uniref:Uncharacterized protein n=1 Tax=Protomyces lactucae-debilis TaxID=2754530 RepID=A0A1Y2F939_PROLT|nr:uncharacterized protein BCR37DRAFT_388441 [Protomyces lactucae-debilis]ORY79415.1 hypothetical protein BCR37DRAFT_388441 [Protomyces lactucae-debilis]
MYNTAKYHCDPCTRVMDSNERSDWDILFRNPSWTESVSPVKKTCWCAITTVLQRLVNQLPVGQTLPMFQSAMYQSPFAPNFCRSDLVLERFIVKELKLVREDWYPDLSTFSNAPLTFISSQDVVWLTGGGSRSNPRAVVHPIACDAVVTDLHHDQDATDAEEAFAAGEKLDLETNCTIKFVGREKPLWGKLGIRCPSTVSVWTGIKQRLQQLYSADPHGERHRKVRVDANERCAELGLYAVDDESTNKVVRWIEENIQPPLWEYL